MRDFGALAFELERLSPDAPEGMPCATQDIDDYLKLESGGAPGFGYDHLRFLRSARINDGKAWLWSYDEAGEPAYCTVIQQGRDVTIGAAANWAKLSPEQYLVAVFFERNVWKGG